MSEAGLPAPLEAPNDLLQETLEEITALARLQAKELAELNSGVEVTKIKLVSPDAPLRFYIKFPAAKPQYEVRRILAEAGWDVGQTIGSESLSFYAAKRRTKSDGWSV